MKKITYSYGTNLDWTVSLAAQMEGEIDGNFIIPSPAISTGNRYFLDCDNGIIAFYADARVHIDLHMIQENLTDDFVGIYYNLTDPNVHFSGKRFSNIVGRSVYNFFILDSAQKTEYFLKAGAQTFELCIFLKKSMLKRYEKKNNVLLFDTPPITDTKKDTITRFDRMDDESFYLLHDLRKLELDGPIFDLNLNATVRLLLSNYLKKVIDQKTTLQTISATDLANIIAVKQFLLDDLESHFPSIKLLADKAHMSDSKFQELFKRITGTTAKSYFMNNKLLIAQELLEENELAVSQISDKLHFTNNSHFASTFKKHFGILPKTFMQQL